jgi:hypothetical protein
LVFLVSSDGEAREQTEQECETRPFHVFASIASRPSINNVKQSIQKSKSTGENRRVADATPPISNNFDRYCFVVKS